MVRAPRGPHDQELGRKPNKKELAHASALEVWRGHILRCERCATIDRQHPATLANGCLEGVRLLKTWKLL